MKTSIMDKTVTTTSYVASVSTAIGGLFTLSNIALFIGIATTLILFFMQQRLYKRRSEQVTQQEDQARVKKKQDDEYHEARMKALRVSKGGISDDIIFVKGTPEPYETPRGLDSREN